MEQTHSANSCNANTIKAFRHHLAHCVYGASAQYTPQVPIKQLILSINRLETDLMVCVSCNLMQIYVNPLFRCHLSFTSLLPPSFSSPLSPPTPPSVTLLLRQLSYLLPRPSCSSLPFPSLISTLIHISPVSCTGIPSNHFFFSVR